MRETKKQLLSRKVAEQEVALLRLKGIQSAVEVGSLKTLELVNIAITQLQDMIMKDMKEGKP